MMKSGLDRMPGAFSFVQLPPCFPERKGGSHRTFQSVRGITLRSPSGHRKHPRPKGESGVEAGDNPFLRRLNCTLARGLTTVRTSSEDHR